MTLERNIFEKFGNNLSKNVKLSNYSWFNLGGDAEYFFKAKDQTQLKMFVKFASENNLKTAVLGAGSNILFRIYSKEQ